MSSCGCWRIRRTSWRAVSWRRSGAIGPHVLPPYAKALADYSRVREHSWSAPGHQGGVAFTKIPAGRAFFDFYGENLFRTDMGIERGQLGSLLDHTGPVLQQRAIRGSRVWCTPQLLRCRRNLRLQSNHHAGLRERGRFGGARPELPQVDRAGPHTDGCPPRLPGPDTQPLRHYRSHSSLASSNPRLFKAKAESSPLTRGSGRTQAGLFRDHQLHL